MVDAYVDMAWKLSRRRTGAVARCTSTTGKRHGCGRSQRKKEEVGIASVVDAQGVAS